MRKPPRISRRRDRSDEFAGTPPVEARKAAAGPTSTRHRAMNDGHPPVPCAHPRILPRATPFFFALTWTPSLVDRLDHDLPRMTGSSR
jgi:hypothetical protein